MASRLNWLRTCKLKQLEAIARATGINSSGTKPILTSNIQDALSPFQHHEPTTTKIDVPTSTIKKPKNGFNIISIDMGIRNLAYCSLSLHPTWLSPTPKKKQPIPTPPTLTSWSRIDVSKSTPIPLSSSSTTTSRETNPTSPPQKQKPKESFHPPLYASHAHTLLTRTILPLQPTHILIERQRFRSMGASSVQEWTLRVNMFESMLYATLHTLKAQGVWEGEVVPMDPSRVARYWFTSADDKGEGKKGRGEKTKKRKMSVAREILRRGEGVCVEEGVARGLVERVLGGKGRGKVGRKGVRGRKKDDDDDEEKEAEGRGLGKFDDLADCLLQGLAWVKWEENKRAVWERGEDVLEGL